MWTALLKLLAAFGTIVSCTTVTQAAVRRAHVGAGQNPTPLPELRLQLTPFYPNSRPQTSDDGRAAVPAGINVTMELPGGRFAAGHALLSLPLSDGPTPTARYDGEDAIIVEDGHGRIPLHYVDAEPDTSQGAVVRTWYLSPTDRRDDSFGRADKLVVHFSAPARKVDNTTMPGPRIDLRFDVGGALVGQGLGFIPVPPSLTGGVAEAWSVTVVWDLDESPADTHGAWSYSDSEKDLAAGSAAAVVGPLNAIIWHSIFAVGRLKRYPAWGHAEASRPSLCAGLGNGASGSPLFAMYWASKPPFDMKVLAQQTEAIYNSIAGFFSSQDPFRVFVRQVEDGWGGTGAMLSFMIEWSPGARREMSSHSVLQLLAHETMHEFALLGRVADGEDEGSEVSWYNEGVADFYAVIAPFRAGGSPLADRSALQRGLNGLAQSYYTSPIVRTAYSTVLAHYWDNLHYTRVSYYRGFIHLAAVAGEIRAATGGKRSLDDVVLELYQRRLAGQPSDLSEWHNITSQLIGAEVEHRWYEKLLSGDLIVPSAECFADLGLRMIRRDAEIFELGFDSNSLRPNSKRVTGLVKGSRAERAGVREGDVVVEAGSCWTVADYLDGMIQMTVLRDDKELVFKWWPRGYEKVESYIWVDIDDNSFDEL